MTFKPNLCTLCSKSAYLEFCKGHHAHTVQNHGSTLYNLINILNNHGTLPTEMTCFKLVIIYYHHCYATCLNCYSGLFQDQEVFPGTLIRFNPTILPRFCLSSQQTVPLCQGDWGNRPERKSALGSSRRGRGILPSISSEQAVHMGCKWTVKMLSHQNLPFMYEVSNTVGLINLVINSIKPWPINHSGLDKHRKPW